MTETGPFTELNSRRLGPVRRFFIRHPRVMDALVSVVAGVAAATSDASRSRGFVVGSVFGLVAAVVLWWRREHPVPVTALLVALVIASEAATGTASGLELAVAFGLYAVVVSHPPAFAWSVAGAVAATMAVALWIWEEPSPDPLQRQADGTVVLTDDRLGSLVGVVMLTLLAVAIGTSVRNTRQHLADLVERANALARDRDRQAELARATERSRIAREMHDVVAHSLSVMITLADGAGAALDRAPERSRAALAELSSTGRSALADMRRVLGALAEDGAPMEPTGHGEDLGALVERFRTAGLPVHADGLGLAPPTDTGLRLALYRVVQEALTNVLRHAPGTARVDLTVRHHPESWEVEVRDHGGVVPVTDAGGAGLGLIGMRERAEVLGGAVEAGPWEHGWRVHVTIPEAR
ncbi:histidine kinase [Isoptericola sp. b441]|uniref:histidine kinase n=1 Tax=Actinotalea lenta TaxID=3064654 RepID=A0ABT9D9A5_9CELL|nr:MULTISPECIES: histidine kinase [unclassified Isoptericola]MDO8106839.1 histidine kinase [Isoptericola sp. b441]MDO8121450.1 histidine kinase [Isoptericola sp. b490]